MRKGMKKFTVIALSGMLTLQPATNLFSDDAVIVAEAHSGRTDSSGGHKDNKNASGLGSYHYHCGGNPPHLHEGGVCPYSSGYSTSSTSSSSGSSSVSSTNQSSSSSGISITGKSIELSSGEDVSISKDLIKILQDVLNQKGYECGTVDGIIGAKTKEAIENFLEDEEDTKNTDYLIISMIAEGLGLE